MSSKQIIGEELLLVLYFHQVYVGIWDDISTWSIWKYNKCKITPKEIGTINEVFDKIQ